ncbi:MAG: hypothetical protein HY665_08820 [Chloroflexi bacterium]|nr:hypothetical protein [Chloroflexota bacterium]
MVELYGYTGKMLRVDLTSGKATEFASDKYVPKYLGGRGLLARMYWDEIRPEVQPFDPDNKLIFAPGPLTATGAIGCGKCEVTTKYPGFYTRYTFSTNTASYIGPALKQAGYDALIVQGKAKVPVYLWINDGKIEIRNAREYWGMTTRKTREELKRKHDSRAIVACIGPAGESLAIQAVISVDSQGAFGKGGIGAVMGSKNLKAIAILGTGRIQVADPGKLLAYNQARGRCYSIKVGEEREIEGGVKIVGVERDYKPQGWTSLPGSALEAECKLGRARTKQGGCPTCPYHCRVKYSFDDKTLPEGAYICAGQMVWIHGEHAVGEKMQGRLNYQAAQLIDDLGFDYLAFAQATYYFTLRGRGFLSSDTCLGDPGESYSQSVMNGDVFWYLYRKGIFNNENTGLPWDKFGSLLFLETLCSQMIDRKGVCGALAQGGMKAVVEYVKSHEEFGPNRGYVDYLFKRSYPKKGAFGSIQSRHGMYTPDPYRAVFAAVGDQCGSEPEPYWNYAGGLPSKVLIKWLGTDKVLDPDYWGPDVAAACIAHENIAVITDSLVYCADLSWDKYQSMLASPANRKNRMVIKWDDLITNSPNGGPEALTAVFGREVTWQELYTHAEMYLSLVRAIWVRDGYTRDGDYDSYWDEVFAEKDDKGNPALPRDKFEQTIQEYYRLRGWKNGVPTRPRLEELGLKDVADELDSMRLLPA